VGRPLTWLHVVPTSDGKVAERKGDAPLLLEQLRARGQSSVPAELRRRWGIEDGGEIGFIDLGGSALIVPGGVRAARAELRRVLADRYEVGIAAIEDPALADR
jgi:bifunctional DNA-binding transcriptional regulator/antitoxin component of YhaV-PrlF toxin-antitoxin module